MLPISIPARELFNEQTGEFLTIGPYYLELEHSLKSISKWEAKTHKSFFEGNGMSPEDFREYVRCMTLNRITDPTVYQNLRPIDFKVIGEYMTDSMSAKTFRPRKKKGPHVVMTSETIYSLMIAYGIPFECDKWHFNRLSALIKTCELNGMGEGGGMSYSERQRWYNELNDQRRKMWNTKG